MPFTDGWCQEGPVMEEAPRGSAITEIAAGHYLLELDPAEGPAGTQLRTLLLDPLARRGVRVYLQWNGVETLSTDALERLQALELKFRIHGGGIGVISTDEALLRRLRITGMSDLLPVYHSVAQALDSGIRMSAYQNDPYFEAG